MGIGDGFRDISTDIRSVRGVRAWNASDNGLIGQHFGSWELDKVNNSYCLKCSGVEIDCVCGFYAYFTEQVEKLELFLPVSVVGVIDGFGQTTIGPKGFRCSKARVLALCKLGVSGRYSYPYRQFGWICKGSGYVRPTNPRVEEEVRISNNFDSIIGGKDIPVFQKFRDMIAEFPPSENPYDQQRQPGRSD